MKKVKKRPVAPVYAVAAVWLLVTLFTGLHTIPSIVGCAIFSMVVYFICKAIFPTVVMEIPEEQPKETPKPEPKPEETADPEVAALMKERDMAISEMRRLNDSIKDETISAQIDHMELVTAKIFTHVLQNPQKKPQIRKFLTYYLPTTIKLLNAYDRMDSTGISGQNIDGTKGKIEDMLTTIETAFDKQLDALFGDEALDISTDITVLENMMAREGLTGSDFNTQTK